MLRHVDDVLRGTASLSAPGSVLVAAVVNRAALRRATSNLDGKTKRKKKSGAKSAWASHCDAPARAFAETRSRRAAYLARSVRRRA